MSPHRRSAARPEHRLGLVLIVAPAAQRDVLHRGQASLGARQDVVELQELALRAPEALLGGEGTLAAVPLPDRALNPLRHVRRRRRWRADVVFIRLATDRQAWPRGHAELLVLDVREQQGDGAVEDRAGIAVGNLAAQERLKPPELVVRRFADRELDAIPLGSRGTDDRARSRRHGRWRRSHLHARFERDLIHGLAFGRHDGGKLAHKAPRIGLGRQRGHQEIDLPDRSSLRLPEHGQMVLRSEMPSEEAHGGQGHLAGSEELEDHREPPAGPRGFDAVGRGIFG